MTAAGRGVVVETRDDAVAVAFFLASASKRLRCAALASAGMAVRGGGDSDRGEATSFLRGGDNDR